MILFSLFLRCQLPCHADQPVRREHVNSRSILDPSATFRVTRRLATLRVTRRVDYDQSDRVFVVRQAHHEEIANAN